MERILSILLAGGVLTFVANIISSLSQRNKVRAEVEKLIADTELVQAESFMRVNQDLNQLRKDYEALFKELQKERISNLKLHAELDRIHREVGLLREELQVERQRNIQLSENLNKQLVTNSEKTVQIVQLRAEIERHAEKLRRFTGDLDDVKRKTGRLLLPGRDEAGTAD